MKKRKSTSKFFIVTFLIIALIFSMVGCNYQTFDTVLSYNKAIVSLPNGEVVEGTVASWRDYENSDQIQVKIGDTTYLVHSNNVALIAE